MCWEWKYSFLCGFQRWHPDRSFEIAAILVLPALTDITELQILQGKENFLRHFICNFTEKMHGYMRLLKKDTPFFWDDQTQQDFDNMK